MVAWATKKIGDVCEVITGGTPSKAKPEYFEGGRIKWLVSGDIHRKEITKCSGRITRLGLENSNAKYLPVNSVMMALNGQGKTRGTVALLRTKATCNQSMVSIYPKDPTRLLPEYVYANLHGRYQEIRRITGDDGNDRRGLNMTLVRNIEIPIAPIKQQERIVAILDEAFAAIATATAITGKNFANALELFQSILDHRTADSADGWRTKELQQDVRFIDYRGRTPRKTEEGMRLITAKNVKMGVVQQEPREYVDPGIYDEWMTRGTPMKGDVLFTTEAPLGNVAQLDTSEKVVFAQRVITLQPNRDVIDPTMLHYVLRSSTVQRRIQVNATGATATGIKASLLKKIRVPLPESIDMQARLAAELTEAEEECKRLAVHQERRAALLTEFKQSILHKAFTGELTADFNSADVAPSKGEV